MQLTANEGNGNTSSCSFTVMLKDVTPPTAQCKNASIQLQANLQATLTIVLTVTERCRP
ncbi:MAG: hypothetical protein ABIQ93_16745 [Saprospiraceae bacterium]